MAGMSSAADRRRCDVHVLHSPYIKGRHEQSTHLRMLSAQVYNCAKLTLALVGPQVGCAPTASSPRHPHAVLLEQP